MIICLPLTFAGESTTPMPESTRLVFKGSGNGSPPTHLKPPHSHLHLLDDGKRSPWVVLAAYCLTTHYSHTTHAGRPPSFHHCEADVAVHDLATLELDRELDLRWVALGASVR